jgi:hypothetical protein
MSRALARDLNAACFCANIDRPALAAALERAADDPDFIAGLIAERTHLIAAAPVFLSAADAVAMARTARAIEAAARLPAYQEAMLARAPDIARSDHGPAGAMMSYDFHLTDAGPRLIEINTNAGGAFLNALIARAQRACCAAVDPPAPLAESFNAAVVAMFEQEWRRQRGSGRPWRIAIVDDAPEQQYLFPEFVLAQRLLARAGIETVIADAAELRFERGTLRRHGQAVDLVYNRLTDFALESPAHAALREAYASGAVVVTPNPRNHALLANKRALALLSDASQLAAWDLGPAHVAQLQQLPRAVEVMAANAEALWAERRNYFFKPSAGYGGKAVYRGDKLTKSAWAHVLAGGYIAQERAEPSERNVRIGQDVSARKLDLRLYAYDGRPLLTAARLYQGQTTNFRTPGGGFAPVLVV